MSIEVLLVEDNVGDVRLTREALREVDVTIQLSVASDGAAAVRYLKESVSAPADRRPNLILLDLMLPQMNGFEVLEEIKGDRNLRCIPVVVLSTSDAESDVDMSYRLQANSYVNKPREWDEFEQLVRSINRFWLTAATLPIKRRSSAASHVRRPRLKRLVGVMETHAPEAEALRGMDLPLKAVR